MRVLCSALVLAFAIGSPAAALTFRWSFTPTVDTTGTKKPIIGLVTGLHEGVNNGELVRVSVLTAPFALSNRYSYDFQSTKAGGPAFIVTGGQVTFADAGFIYLNNQFRLGDQAGIFAGGYYPSLISPNNMAFKLSRALFTPRPDKGGAVVFVSRLAPVPFAGDRFAAFDFATPSAANVPEPESWAMLIAGFGLTGAFLRRSRATTTLRKRG